MEEHEILDRLNDALRQVADRDQYLLEFDLSERCIAARLAFYLQVQIADYFVDVEYNRDGATPKRLGLPEVCANYRNADGEGLVVPDVIVHRRGREGPNILVLEVKKSTNREPRDCDRARVTAFREQMKYSFGALIECEMRPGYAPAIAIAEWITG